MIAIAIDVMMLIFGRDLLGKQAENSDNVSCARLESTALAIQLTRT